VIWVTGAGFEVPGLGEELHPLRPMRTETRRNPNSARQGRRRTKGKRRSAATETASKRAIVGVATAADCVCEVVTVRTEVALPVSGTLTGANVQAA
jgi:hypothetical protein